MSNKIAGLIDFPVSDMKIYRPEISVRGYAFTEDDDDLDVRVFVDQQQVETARWGLPRMDVYRKYNIEPAYLSGFVVRCPIPGFTMGKIRQEHNFTASVKSGKNGEEVILGPIRFYSGRKDDNDEPVTRFIFPAGAPGLYRKFGQEHLESLITEGGLQPFHDVLEIGCGMGRTAVKLAGYLRMNSKYYGIDVLSEAIVYNNSNISSRYRNFHFRHLDIHNEMYNPDGDIREGKFSIPLKDESVDFTYCWSLFTHLKPHDVKQYLSEINRVLKPGGVLYASCYLLTEERRNNDHKVGPFNFDIKGDQYWTKDRKMAEQAIALEPGDLLGWYRDNNLSVDGRDIHLIGSLTPSIAHQDVLIARKN